MNKDEKTEGRDTSPILHKGPHQGLPSGSVNCYQQLSCVELHSPYIRNIEPFVIICRLPHADAMRFPFDF